MHAVLGGTRAQTESVTLIRPPVYRRLSARPRPNGNEAEGAAELETEAGSNAFAAYWTGDGCDE